MFSYLNLIPCLSTVTFWWQVLAPHSHSARSFTSLLADLSTTVAPNLHQHYFPPSLHRCEHASSPPFSFNPLSTQTRSPAPQSRIDRAAISSLSRHWTTFCIRDQKPPNNFYRLKWWNRKYYRIWGDQTWERSDDHTPIIHTARRVENGNYHLIETFHQLVSGP